MLTLHLTLTNRYALIKWGMLQARNATVTPNVNQPLYLHQVGRAPVEECYRYVYRAGGKAESRKATVSLLLHAHAQLKEEAQRLRDRYAFRRHIRYANVFRNVRRYATVTSVT